MIYSTNRSWEYFQIVIVNKIHIPHNPDVYLVSISMCKSKHYDWSDCLNYKSIHEKISNYYISKQMTNFLQKNRNET